MAVSGVRSSCETFATKSRRTWSAWRRSVMSCSTSTAPPPAPATGAARAKNRREKSRPSASSCGSTSTPRNAAVSWAEMSGWRITSRYRRSTADSSTWSIAWAARLTSWTRPCRSSTSTPSTMPDRIASMRARSRVSSSRRRPSSCTGPSNAGDVPELIVGVVVGGASDVSRTISTGR